MKIDMTEHEASAAYVAIISYPVAMRDPAATALRALAVKLQLAIKEVQKHAESPDPNP